MTDWAESGTKAPDFTLTDDQGKQVSLKQFSDQPVVLYFYPKDDTPGCTKEACGFRDLRDELAELGAVVLGISGDTVASHQKFREKYKLNFPLLADEGFRVSQLYGAYREKNMYGKKSMGIQRSTFLIDGNRKIIRVWKRVKVEGHDQEVLAALRELIETE
jgi:peroxiredoxin Q/BCP